MCEASFQPDFWWNWGVNAAVAFGTLLAVLVALFGQAFRAKFFPPQLLLNLLSEEGTEAVTRLTWEENGKQLSRDESSRYYHLRVQNRRRWSPATEVQVVLLQVEEMGPGGDMKIVWTGPIPMGWRHQQLFPASRTIGASGDVDLCSVIKGKWLQLHPMIVPFNLVVKHERKCDFVLVLQAQGNEGDSPIVRIAISWDGTWHDGSKEMKNHLSVKIV